MFAARSQNRVSTHIRRNNVTVDIFLGLKKCQIIAPIVACAQLCGNQRDKPPSCSTNPYSNLPSLQDSLLTLLEMFGYKQVFLFWGFGHIWQSKELVKPSTNVNHDYCLILNMFLKNNTNLPELKHPPFQKSNKSMYVSIVMFAFTGLSPRCVRNSKNCAGSGDDLCLALSMKIHYSSILSNM